MHNSPIPSQITEVGVKTSPFMSQSHSCLINGWIVKIQQQITTTNSTSKQSRFIPLDQENYEHTSESRTRCDSMSNFVVPDSRSMNTTATRTKKHPVIITSEPNQPKINFLKWKFGRQHCGIFETRYKHYPCLHYLQEENSVICYCSTNDMADNFQLLYSIPLCQLVKAFFQL